VFIHICHKYDTPVLQIREEESVKIVRSVNQCGCTDYFVKFMTLISFALFIVFFIIAIFAFGRTNPTGSSAFFLIGFACLVTSIVGCNLLYCACCRPAIEGEGQF
jgi:lipopolysaccharide export LptBFGC system permease protein LptF